VKRRGASRRAHGGRRRALVLGLTGTCGAGKSAVAAVFAARGAQLIDLDRIGHECLALPRVKRRLRRAFGAEIFGPDGAVERAKLARRAFATPATCRALNAAVHPALIAEAQRRIAAARRRNVPGRVTVVVGTLLGAFGLDRLMDRTICVAAGFARRAAWLRKARGWTAAELRRRDRAAALAPLGQRRRAGTVKTVLVNNGSRADLNERSA